MNPRSLANLHPFQPGQSGNPAGRPNAGLSMIEWFNQFESMTRAQVQAIADDETQSVSRVAAARQWLRAIENGSDADRILDRTVGRPAQSVDVTSNGESVNLTPIKLDGDREL